MAAVNTENSALIKAKASSLASLNKTSSKTSVKSCGKFEKKPCSEISFKDFLDFLRTAYHINEAIEGVPNDINDKVEINWHDIAMNEFVSSLLVGNDNHSNTRIMIDDVIKLSEKESKNKSLVNKSKNISTGNNDLSKFLESELNTSQEIPLDAKSEISDYSVEHEPVKFITRITSAENKDNLQKGNTICETEQTDKSGIPKEKMLHERKISSTVAPDPQKSKILISAKHVENKKKITSNRKDVFVKKSSEENNKGLEHLMKRKLNEVIQEGLLDSVLPYVVPKQMSAHSIVKKPANGESKKPATLSSVDKSSSGQFSKEKLAVNNRRKSSAGEVEVEIHVCDEVKNLKRDFRCPQKLLVSKMGYFAEVTTGQKLEDMDISVHCDITIFDWLMRWVKKDSSPEESWPKLDAGNVVPILVSAAFLQMDPLLQDCLEFCRQHMNEIAKTSTNLACLNDNILTRLANLFSNSDVENLRDKKDKIQSRLYCKLISALTETSPEPARGHFASLANVYKCGKCERLVLRQLGGRIPCKPSNMKMDRFGNVHGNHIRDQNWNLSDYIRGLRQELKSWRQVYWRVWGDCHFLNCSLCHNYFPVHQMHWCCHHPEPPQFFTMEHQRAMTFPIGRYPCCGDRAYRFEVLHRDSGCHYKEHTPVVNSPRDTEVLKLFTKYQNLITVEPPKLQFPERLTRLVSNRGESVSREVQWWDGIELAPPRPRQGLLSKLWETHQKKEQQKNTGASSRNNSSASSGTNSVIGRPITSCGRPPIRKQMSVTSSAGSNVCNPEIDNSSSNDDSSSSSSSSDTDDNSEESGHAPVRRVTTKPRRIEVHYCTTTKNRGETSNQWIPKLSVRNNQDNQREYEERAVRQMAALLTRRTCGDSASFYARTHNRSYGHGHHSHSIWNNHIIPQGGTYVRLEHEWREAHCHSHACHGNSNRPRSMGWTTSSRPRVRAPR